MCLPLLIQTIWRADTQRKFRARFQFRNARRRTRRPVRAAAIGAFTVVFLTVARLCPGQELRLSSVAARQGDDVAIEISLISPNADAPQVLQWDTTIPAARLSFLEDQMRLGASSEAAHKSIACVLKINSPDTRTMTCIVAGGLDTISNGLVALLRLKIRPDAAPGRAQIRADAGVAVLKGLKRVSLPPVETVVVVQPASSAPNGASKK